MSLCPWRGAFVHPTNSIPALVLAPSHSPLFSNLCYCARIFGPNFLPSVWHIATSRVADVALDHFLRNDYSFAVITLILFNIPNIIFIDIRSEYDVFYYLHVHVVLSPLLMGTSCPS